MKLTSTQRIGLIGTTSFCLGMIAGALVSANHYSHSDTQLRIGIATGTEATGIALKDFLRQVNAGETKVVTNWPAVVDFFAESFMRIGRRDRSNIIAGNH